MVVRLFIIFTCICWVEDKCTGRQAKCSGMMPFFKWWQNMSVLELDKKTSLNNIQIESYFADIIEKMGDNPERSGMKKTPKRAREAFEFLTQGYHQSLKKIINGAIFETKMDEMILIKDIELYSLCEHHLLPFIGNCHIAYIPDGKVLGLSKIARIVDLYARRLQVQENLTKEIADTIQQVAQAKGVGIIIEEQHLCMMMRGVEKQNSIMTTSVMLGTLREDPQSRAEFFNLVHRG